MALSYETSGLGIPVVLIHAFPLSSSMWKPQIKNLERKGKMIVLDLPGFGKSPYEAKTTVPKMAQEAALLLDSLKVTGPVMMAGLSMGGYVAFEFFRQFPTRVKALGLFSTRAGADTPEAHEKRIKTAEQILKDGLEDFFKKTVPNLVGKSTQESNPKLLREIMEMISSNSREGVAAGLLAIAGRRDSTDLLASIKCPTLIIAGDEDTLIPFSESEAMHTQIKGSQFHLIPKAGHLVNLEQPEAFQKVFEKFLAQKL